MKKKLLSSLLITGMVMGSTVPAFAAEFGTQLQIDAKATTVNMTVPGTAPMIFNENGSNTVPTDFTITNNSSIAAVNLASINLDANASGWTLVPEITDVKVQAVNKKAIKLKLGAEGFEKIVAPTGNVEASTGSVTLGQSDFSIEANGSKKLSFVVERGAFTTPTSGAAFNMTMNFEFNQ